MTAMPCRATLLILCALCVIRARAGEQLVVSPTGVPDAAGTLESPLDLATGLSKLGPDVVLWIRGGLYTVDSGITISRGGAAGHPAILRNYNGERVSIEGNTGSAAVITIVAEHVWLWGLEIYSSEPTRISRERGAFPSDIQRLTGVATAQVPGGGRGFRLINCIVRDGFNGIAFWSDATDAELYGNLILNNGWEGADKGWNHGIYAQNKTGSKRLIDNIIFNQFSHGIHAYGSENASLDNFHLEGNIVFNNGGPSLREGFARNILVGGGRLARNPVLLHNYTYYPPRARDGSNDIGYSAGCEHLSSHGNYFIGPVALRMNCRDVAMTHNTFLGTVTGFHPRAYPDNRYLSSAPPETWVFVRPNRYDPDRAHVVIYNWKLENYVSVDAGSFLQHGDHWEARDAQDYFGEPVAKGVYEGGALWVPMAGRRVMQPVGTVPVAAAHTGPEFGALVLLRVRPPAEEERSAAAGARRVPKTRK